MRLGVDSYSLRWQGWDAFQLMEYAAGLGLDNVHFSERRHLASLGDDYLASLRQRADDLGLTLELGMMSFDRYAQLFNPALGSGEKQLTDMARAAKAVGSPVVRCLLGSAADRLGPVSVAEHIAECIRTLKAAAPVARDLGVRFAVENHGGVDLLARELRAIIEEVGSDVVGACLDTGNPAYGGEDPVVSAEVLGPYVISSHVRDTRVWATPEGAMVQWVPMGQGNIDLRQIVAILAREAPTAPVDLEIITCHAPRPIRYKDPRSDFWRMYPDMLARDFVRFVALAESGKPEALEQAVLPPGLGEPPAGAPGEVLRSQQRRHFEESVRYCQDILGIGERGRA